MKRLLEIKGDKKNSGSIFDRLNISPNLDFERILAFEFDDDNFANTIPTVEAILTADGCIATTQNPLEMLMKRKEFMQTREKMKAKKDGGGGGGGQSQNPSVVVQDDTDFYNSLIPMMNEASTAKNSMAV